MRLRTLVRSAAAGLAVGAIVAPAAGAAPYTLGPQVLASGASPFVGCPIGSAGPTSVNYPYTEVEPQVAVNPTSPDNIVGNYQQDRWNDGGAKALVAARSSDGGASWARNWAPFSACSGGDPDYPRTTDPWVSYDAGGRLYQIALSIDSAELGLSAVLASTSTDDGATWSTPETIQRDENPVNFNDKESITGDWTREETAYAVWIRGSIPGDNRSERSLQRSFALLFKGSGIQPPQANQVFMAVTRSTDGGRSWHKIEKIAPIRTALLTDPDNPNPTSLDQTIRADDYLPDIAVDHATGDIYVVWSDGLGTAVNNVVITKSTDGGRRWSAPRAIDQAPGPHAFNQTVQVAGDGTVAVLYYDFRTNTPAPGLPTDVWLTQSTDGGASWEEQHVTGPFDMKLAPNARGFFLGDYMGLEAIGDDLLAFFATTQGDSANVYSVRANR